MDKTYKKYRSRKWFSLDDLVDFICEYNRDGKFNKTALNFWRWLDKKSKISDQTLDKLKKMKHTKFIILALLIAITGHFSPTRTAYAVSEEGQRRLDAVYKDRPCAEYYISAPYSLDWRNIPNANTAERICELEKVSAELERKSAQLQLKLDGLETQVKNQPTPTATIQDSSRVEALEKRVSLLERAVSSIQTTVLSAINKAISILDKLLK